MSEEDPFAFPSPMKRQKVSFSLDPKRSRGGVGSASGTGEEGGPSGASKKTQHVLVAKFKRIMKRGSAIRSSPTRVRAALQTVNRATVSVRRLSSPQVEMPSDQSLLVQYEDADNKFENMSKTLKDQVHKLIKVNHELDDLRRKVGALSRKQDHVDLFTESSQELAIWAFLNYVLHKFYEAAKVEQRIAFERAHWLFSPEVVTFVQEHEHGHLVFKEFNNNHVVINATLLRPLQLAKHVSSNLSSATCHNSTPEKVAIAFQELHQFKKNPKLKEIFKEIFGMDPGDMVQNYDDGEREKFLTTFTLWK